MKSAALAAALLSSLTFAAPATQLKEIPLQPMISDVAIGQAPLSASSTDALIAAAAARYGANYVQLRGTLWCESHFISRQSLILKDGGPNGREDSWGVAQIHLPAHPEITKAQALSPRFAIDWSARQFSLGRQSMWSCWQQIYGAR